jgi:hypothetical protein
MLPHDRGVISTINDDFTSLVTARQTWSNHRKRPALTQDLSHLHRNIALVFAKRLKACHQYREGLHNHAKGIGHNIIRVRLVEIFTYG